MYVTSKVFSIRAYSRKTDGSLSVTTVALYDKRFREYLDLAYYYHEQHRGKVEKYCILKIFIFLPNSKTDMQVNIDSKVYTFNMQPTKPLSFGQSVQSRLP